MAIKGSKKLREWELKQKKKANKKRYGFTITKRMLHKGCSRLGSTEKLILFNLHCYASPDGYCYPSMRHQGRDLGLDVHTIQRNIKKLNKKGFIRIEVERGVGGKRFGYWILRQNDEK